jgi:ferredoxin
MSLFVKWLESLATDVHISERCSRSITPKSTCTSCLDHCPANAISIQVHHVKIDSNYCDSCGECVIVCPVAAITGTMPKRQIKNGMLVYDSYYCPTLKELLIYRKKGIKGIAVPGGWYDAEWVEVISEVNNVLPLLGLQPFFFKNKEEFGDPVISRRELFHSAKRNGQRVALELTPAVWRQNPKAWSLPSTFEGYQFYEVKLDKEKCTLCQACFSLCPEGALRITDSEVVLDHQKCANCSVCVDACPEGALYIFGKVTKSSVSSFLFEKGKCKRCKQSFFTFHHDGSGLCHVCSGVAQDWLMP